MSLAVNVQLSECLSAIEKHRPELVGIYTTPALHLCTECDHQMLVVQSCSGLYCTRQWGFNGQQPL